MIPLAEPICNRPWPEIPSRVSLGISGLSPRCVAADIDATPYHFTVSSCSSLSGTRRVGWEGQAPTLGAPLACARFIMGRGSRSNQRGDSEARHTIRKFAAPRVCLRWDHFSGGRKSSTPQFIILGMKFSEGGGCGLKPRLANAASGAHTDNIDKVFISIPEVLRIGAIEIDKRQSAGSTVEDSSSTIRRRNHGRNRVRVSIGPTSEILGLGSAARHGLTRLPFDCHGDRRIM
jgi:hypothetical protein